MGGGDKKISVTAKIQLGSELELQKTLEKKTATETGNIRIGTKGPSILNNSRHRPDMSRDGTGVIEDKFLYSFTEGNQEFFIKDQGLCQTYGIFGVPGCGKTYLLKHLLSQIVSIEKDKPAAKFGGLILDPKGALLDDVINVFRKTGREDDLIILNDNFLVDNNLSLNIIDSFLKPIDLGKAMSLAARSAGIDSKEAFWLNNLGTIFGAGLEILKFQQNTTRTKPTLKELMALLLDVVDTKEQGNERFKPRLRIELDYLYNSQEELSGIEQQQFISSSGILENFLVDKDKATIRSFIDQSYGLFRRPENELYSKEYSPEEKESIYDLAVDDGKFILVSLSRKNLALSKILCTIIKTLFQQTVLTHLDRYNSEELKSYERPLLFLADEYSDVATELEGSPMGDSSFFSLMRQYGCMGLVATQSIHMLKNSALKDTWKSVFGNMVGKIFMQLSDHETAEEATKLVGESEIRAIMNDISISKEGPSLSGRHEVKDKKDLPTRILLQTLGRGEAVLVGATDGKSRPSSRFLKVQGHLYKG